MPYLQVAEIIRSQIRSGQLPVGSRINEAEITETYEVARSTARRKLAVLPRRKLAVLRDEGLIFTVPQRGSTSADSTSALCGLFVPKPTREVACHRSYLVLTCLAPSVDVRWRPLVSVAVVTHLVTHPPRGRGGGGHGL